MTTITSLAADWDVLVVGAGPAGMAAATVASRAGLSTLLVDEGPSPGGQIWRAVTTTPVMRRPVLGDDYWCGADAVRAFERSGTVYLPATTVWSLDGQGRAGLSHGGGARIVTASRVIVATGALERPFPVPGWTLPGVMTVGGAQGLLKASGLYPGGRLVIAGTGPLIWLYAAQLLRAGGRIEAILDTTDRRARYAAAARLPSFLASSYLGKGLALMAEVRRRVRVVGKVTSLVIEGDQKVDGVRYACARRQEARLPANTVLLHQGVVPQTSLAMAAGVRHRWDDDQLCFVPEINADGATSHERIAIAGDSAGIAGWEAAVTRGHLAGIAAVRALGGTGDGLPDAAACRRRLAALEGPRGFLDRLYRPARSFRIPTGDTIVCRCEEVRAGEIERAVDLGCLGPAQLKSFTRAGMGPCQGRLCGLTVTEMIASRRGVPQAEVGTARPRPPVKPITVAELASLPAGEQDLAAVIGRRR
ncbi:MAG: FAD-dependent oxidoreductase [Hyphomicrobiaceae bacterium]|nr:FAD-dependent oxidoreductase [Hyphomicrobiaceae bacterium]